jgi:hypothetical protein
VHRHVHSLNLSADPIAGASARHQRPRQPFYTELGSAERAFLARRLAYHRGALALVRAKLAIAEGRFDDARDRLTAAAAVKGRAQVPAGYSRTGTTWRDSPPPDAAPARAGRARRPPNG